ncbi:MAG: glycosyltransferase family 9 protein [Victivallaceae bacterium]
MMRARVSVPADSPCRMRNSVAPAPAAAAAVGTAAVKRILVIKPSSLGDIFHTFAAVSLLKQFYPDAELDWLVHPAFAEALDFSPFPVRKKILFNRRNLAKISAFPREFRHLVGELRRERYDLVIDFQGLMRSSIFGFLARGPRPEGFAAPREAISKCLYGERHNVDMKLHAVERNIALVQRILGTDRRPEAFELPSGRFALELPAELAGRRLIGVIPGARWRTKAFPAAFFAEVIDRIAEKVGNCAFVIIGSRADEPAAAAIASQLKFAVAVSLAGKTSIGQMIEVMRRFELVLSNDSGPVHVAAAQNVPVFGFFGPTDPALTGPFGGNHRIFQAGLACAKCLGRQCRLDRDDPPCHRLDAATVAAAAVQQLTREI